MPLIFLFSI